MKWTTRETARQHLGSGQISFLEVIVMVPVGNLAAAETTMTAALLEASSEQHPEFGFL
jgi:hypothetical protein